MRTRNADSPKPTTTVKKTPPARKLAAKTPATPTEQTPSESSATPKSTETKRVPATKVKQVKPNETPTNSTPTPVSKPEAAVVAAKASVVAAKVTPGTKVASGTKTTRKVVKRIIRRKTATSAKAGASKSPKPAEVGEGKVEESTVKESAEVTEDVESAKTGEPCLAVVEDSAKKEEPSVAVVEASEKMEEPSRVVFEESAEKDLPAVSNAEVSTKEDKDVADAGEVKQDNQVPSDALPSTEKVGASMKEDDAIVTDVGDPVDNQESSIEKEKEDADPAKEDMEITADKVEPENVPVDMEKDIHEELKEEEVQNEDICHGDEKMEEDIGDEARVELGEEELAEDDVSDHDEAEEALEEERAEITAVAEERKTRKEFEIFVGGLDRNATEEDVKRAFENVGEVVEVRLHKELSPNKNKGYAFVRFAKKEQASRALSEMKNPVICGKRCGTAPSEDNDTLFLGNICNTWTKDAIRQKLKDYGINGVGKITLVADPQHDGLSRGFAFLQFSCHPDAMLAFKRLQKPDVVFGHPERTAKVAFAEPLREPDPEVMAQVKSVFLDGLPPQWDEDTVREQFKGYGEIERIVLARNMSTAKRKDFGFLDFTTREAALASIEGINSREFSDGKIKTKVRARISNPLPKTQAVKGGMYGGFRIGHATGTSFSKSGRGFGRGGQASSRPAFQRGRAFYQHGHGRTGRAGFPHDHEIADPYPFRGRHNIARGGRWDSFRGAQQSSGAGTVPPRFDLDRSRHGVADRDRERHMPIRGQPFPPEEEFGRPFGGRHFDDRYFYDDNARGMKRPYFADQDPDYIEPSRGRPRLDYSDSAISHPGNRYRGAGSGPYSRDYYGYDYDGGAYSSFHAGDRPYGGRYYY